MSRSNTRFLCVNNYNSNKCFSIPFEYTKETNAFVLAQALFERTEGFFYLSELLDVLEFNLEDEKSEIFGMPFGYDGSYRTAYIESCFVCTRPEWNEIKAKDLEFKRIPYILVDGKPEIDDIHLFDKKELLTNVISEWMHAESQKLIGSVGFDKYWSKGFKKYEYERVRCEIEELALDDTFKMGDVEVKHNLYIESFEELAELFPEYKKYETLFANMKFEVY